MEIHQTRVVLRARNFDRTVRFYELVPGLPRLSSWSSEDGRQTRFQAGTTAIEVLGRPRVAESGRREEEFDYQGPDHELSIEVVVDSAEEARQELLLRDRNIPGGLRQEPGGGYLFGTHDPDGVWIFFQEAG